MHTKKTIQGILCLSICFGTVNAQKDNKVTSLLTPSIAIVQNNLNQSVESAFPIQIGEKVPNLRFNKVLNMSKSYIELNDFEGKLIILDFWSTWCSVCIAQFPKIESLQNQFDKHIQILPIGFDVNKPGSIIKYLDQNKGTKRGLSIPNVIQADKDSILIKLFPYEGFPHQVWIDKNGYLIGVTDHRSLTESNIQRLLNGENLKFKERKPTTYVSPVDNFLLPRNAGADSLKVWGSAISGFVEGAVLGSVFGLQYDSTQFKLYDVNNTLYGLYRNAYSYYNKKLNKRWASKIIKVSNGGETKYLDWPTTDTLDNWQIDKFCKDNLFCYEIIAKRGESIGPVYDKMIQDLNYHFRINSRIERKSVDCWLIIPTGEKNSDTSLAPPRNGRDTDSYIFSTAESLIDYLNTIAETKDFFLFDNEKAFKPIKIDISTEKVKTFNEIKQILLKNGLTLRKSKTDVDFLCLESIK